MLTFDIWNNNSYFCQTLRPPSPLPPPDNAGMYCPLGPGDFVLSTAIPLGKSYALATFNTRLRALDPSQHEMLCLDLVTTPVKPTKDGIIVGEFHILFWGTVALAIAYWLVVGIARVITARGRGSSAGKGAWARVEGAGFILASAISGERLATSPALMRFCEFSVVAATNCENSCPSKARHRYATSYSIRNGVQLLPWSLCSGQVLSVRHFPLPEGFSG